MQSSPVRRGVIAPRRGPRRSILERLAPAGSILCFHGIVTPETPSSGVANMSCESVIELLASVRRIGEIVPLREILGRHRKNQSTSGLVAITFDDAYASLHGPLLESVRTTQTPITLFATTDRELPARGFWWDRIDDAFGRTAATRWREFEDSIGLPLPFRRQQPTSLGPLRPLRQWILFEWKGRLPAHVDRALEQLEAEIGFRSRQRPLGAAALAELAADPLVDVAVHTVSHPVLPLLDDGEIAREVRECHQTLHSHIDDVLPVLAFPFGLFDERTARVARDAGMEACVSLGDHTMAWSGRLPAGVVPRLSMSRGLTPWKLRLHLTGAVEQINDFLGRAQPDLPALPSVAS
jgi:peptidoglycan/xylan/chitin deacetylase (PgdA/CDA1 family)